MALLLVFAALFFIRRGGVAVLLVAATLAFGAGGSLFAAGRPEDRINRPEPRAATITAVKSEGTLVTLELAGGASLTLEEKRLQIKDRRLSGSEKRTQNKSARHSLKAAGPRAMDSTTAGKAHGKITAADLAAMLAGSRTTATGSGLPVLMKIVERDGKPFAVKLQLHADELEARSAAASIASRRAAAKEQRQKQSH